MAREEQDREDLLAEAKALVQRASVRLGGEREETVVGFRRDGSASVFLGPQRVYQFTARGALRRAFVDDLLYKAERGKLVALRRERTERAVELVRHELNDAETAGFLDDVHTDLARLGAALAAGDFSLVGQVPQSADVVERVRAWLDGLGKIAIAASPRVR